MMHELTDRDLQKLMQKNQVVLTQKQKSYLKWKRFLDFVCSFIALVILTPVFLVLAILIKIDSPKDPIYFKQERIGQNGRIFTLRKFRSMKQGTPELGTSEFVDAEQYITRVGRFLRKTSLDELPQLYSVMVGDMSLIGTPFIIGTTKKSLINQGFSAA